MRVPTPWLASGICFLVVGFLPSLLGSATINQRQNIPLNSSPCAIADLAPTSVCVHLDDPLTLNAARHAKDCLSENESPSAHAFPFLS